MNLKQVCFGLLVLASLFYFSGCNYDYWAPSFPYSVGVYVEPGFPADSALEGCKAWNEVGANCHQEPDVDKAFVRVYNNTEKCANGTDYAWTYPSNHAEPHSDIYVKLDCDRSIFIDTITHEFGHAFGMPHLPEPNAVMYHTVVAQTMRGPHVKLTAADVEEFSRVWSQQ